MSNGRRQLVEGDRGRDFVTSLRSGESARFYARAGGRPMALVFDRHGDDPRLIDLAGQLAERSDVALHCVASVQPPAAEDFLMWLDPEGTVAEAYGVADEELTAVVLDPNLRVVGIVAGEQFCPRVIQFLDAAVHRDPSAEVTAQAPVLLVPRVLDQAMRDWLIHVWDQEGATSTGVLRSSGESLDDGYKRRRDHTVADPDLLRTLSSVIGRAVMPEIRKAFAYNATRFEGFKIACYDTASGGFFRPHRDNLTPETAHRAFALTLNLNDGYQGGHLRFPEYGNQLYRPEAGGALIFSCSLLHEVIDMAAGRRFVLLSFLYGEPRPSPTNSPTATRDGRSTTT